MPQPNEAERRRWNDPQWTQLWPRRERLTDAVTPELLKAAALQRGERLLDIGCGAGGATLRAARIVGAGGSVVGADISAPLAALATTRASAAGALNVTFQVADIQTAQIMGAPFDVAISQFGVMFFDDPVSAFANIRSQLGAGARFIFACWQGAERNPWFFGPALAGLVPAGPQPPTGRNPTGPFTLADGARTRGLLEQAGFSGVELDRLEATVDAPEDAVVDDTQLAFMGVTPERMGDAHAAVQRQLSQFRQPSGLSRFPLAYQILTARNPAR